MRLTRQFEYSPEQKRALRRAKILAWITLAYLSSVGVLMFMVLGQSQAMKTVWIEDLLSMIPAACFLIAADLYNRKPSKRFPYGFHRVVSILFLVASLAFVVMGSYLLYEAAKVLITQEHPTVGTLRLFGHTVWIGWLAFPVLLYSGLPAVMLGRMKLPLGPKINDKILMADAAMNKDDWLTALGGIVGMGGIGMGIWWMDGVAAGLVSFAILRDGWTHTRDVVGHLMNERPRSVGSSDPDLLPERFREHLCSLDWVADAQVRMREEGHVYFGEAFLVPRDPHHSRLLENLNKAAEGAKALDWRIFALVVMPVAQLESEPARTECLRGEDPRR